ncbi:hypothetical protein LSAT2_010109, partial [Lamellibrachia satsuma]
MTRLSPPHSISHKLGYPLIDEKAAIIDLSPGGRRAQCHHWFAEPNVTRGSSSPMSPGGRRAQCHQGVAEPNAP